MSFLHRHSRIALVAICCVALGAGASAIASAGAATSGPSAKAHARQMHGLRRLALRAVHADLVVATKQGFVNVTVDRGRVDSVTGQQLTLTEGTKKQTYKTVTLTIPSSARVRDDRRPASLSSLRTGQRVLVVTAPKRTFVIARTPRQG
jgi:hypothetical protein